MNNGDDVVTQKDNGVILQTHKAPKSEDLLLEIIKDLIKWAGTAAGGAAGFAAAGAPGAVAGGAAGTAAGTAAAYCCAPEIRDYILEGGCMKYAENNLEDAKRDVESDQISLDNAKKEYAEASGPSLDIIDAIRSEAEKEIAYYTGSLEASKKRLEIAESNLQIAQDACNEKPDIPGGGV
jgi:hypothetical protein